MLRDVQSRYGGWQFHEIIRTQIRARVGHHLQQRDAHGIRVYESYAVPGQREHRWMPLRAMTRDTLRAVMRETRTQERQLHIKGSGYQYFLEELERVGDSATVDQVYDQAVPRILAHRNRGAA